jgi:DNA-binding response OmpR family regulator
MHSHRGLKSNNRHFVTQDHSTVIGSESTLDDSTDALAPWPTVLCIDDDPEISRVLQVRLREFQVEVFRAYSGIHGYWLAVTHKPDAIITDLAMPQGTGDYVLESLKANVKTAGIPVIVLTGRRDKAMFQRMTDGGAAAILTKPVDFQELYQILSTHLAF